MKKRFLKHFYTFDDKIYLCCSPGKLDPYAWPYTLYAS